jgi:hypothetical protein
MAMVEPLESPADQFVDSPPEVEVSKHLVRHGLILGPALVLLSGLIWGIDGALSSAFAVGLVLVNFLLAAFLLARAARISLTMVMVAALGGFALRMGIILAAILLVKEQGWVELLPLAITLLVTHLGLLLWETRYVSASLAFPGLKPKGV